MALDAPLLSRKRVLAAVAETTTGTAPSLSGSNAGFNVEEIKFTGDAGYYRRLKQGSLGTTKGKPTSRQGTATFKQALYLKQATGLPAWMTVLWPACGLSLSTATWTVSTSPTASVTLADYMHGKRKLLTGCFGTFDMSIEHDKPVMIDYKFMGVHQTPTDTAIIAPTYDTQLPLVGANTLTFDSTDFTISSLKFSLGAKVVMRKDINAFDGDSRYLGFKSAWITEIIPTITINPEESLQGTYNWDTKFLDATEIAWNCVIGSGSNNTLTLSAANCQLVKLPEDTDDDGIATKTITLELNNDSFTAVCS